MRCNICDRLLKAPTYNRELKTWEPCDTCMEVITDCLNDFKDNAVWAEEDLDQAFREADIFPNETTTYHEH